MRAVLLCLLSLLMVFPALADPPQSLTLDFNGQIAPALTVFQANQKTFQWSLINNGTALSGTGYTPFMYWAQSNTAASVVTATCTWVTQTSGIFNASFSPSDLNTSGSKIYGVGVVSGNVTVARQGVFTMRPDPYASGAGAITYTTNLNWSVYAYSQTFDEGPYRFLYSSHTTNADGSISVTITSTTAAVETDPIAAAWSNQFVPVTATNGWEIGSHGTFVTAAVTNGMASTSYVAGLGYVTVTITNGLASTNWVVAQSYVTASITNGFATTQQLTSAGTYNHAEVTNQLGGDGTNGYHLTDAEHLAVTSAVASGIATGTPAYPAQLGTAAYSNSTQFENAGAASAATGGLAGALGSAAWSNSTAFDAAGTSASMTGTLGTATRAYADAVGVAVTNALGSAAWSDTTDFDAAGAAAGVTSGIPESIAGLIASNYYPSANPSNFYPSANPSNWVTGVVTGGLPEAITALAGYTNPAQTAYGWGNHASGGYASTQQLVAASNVAAAAKVTADAAYPASNPSNFIGAESDTLEIVAGRGNVATNTSIIISNNPLGGTYSVELTTNHDFAASDEWWASDGDFSWYISGVFRLPNGVGASGTIWPTNSMTITVGKPYKILITASGGSDPYTNTVSLGGVTNTRVWTDNQSDNIYVIAKTAEGLKVRYDMSASIDLYVNSVELDEGEFSTNSFRVWNGTAMNSVLLDDNAAYLKAITNAVNDNSAAGKAVVAGRVVTIGTNAAAGAGDMTAATYDPAGGTAQVAFSNDITAVLGVIEGASNTLAGGTNELVFRAWTNAPALAQDLNMGGNDVTNVTTVYSTNANSWILFDGIGWVIRCNGTNLLLRVN